MFVFGTQYQYSAHWKNVIKKFHYSDNLILFCKSASSLLQLESCQSVGPDGTHSSPPCRLSAGISHAVNDKYEDLGGTGGVTDDRYKHSMVRFSGRERYACGKPIIDFHILNRQRIWSKSENELMAQSLTCQLAQCLAGGRRLVRHCEGASTQPPCLERDQV